jgi:hypothetical protein
MTEKQMLRRISDSSIFVSSLNTQARIVSAGLAKVRDYHVKQHLREKHAILNFNSRKEQHVGDALTAVLKEQ